MKLIQIRNKAEALALRQSYFNIDAPPNVEVMIHAISIGGVYVGYVATEDFGAVAGPHLFVKEGYRNRSYMKQVDWIFRKVYCPLMKGLGKQWLVTNCDQADSGTINFLSKAGFTIKKTTVAEYTL